MISSVAVNELIIRNMRSVQRIEASNRAYLAAEGGVEDALYELTPHFAGYQTPALTETNVRKTDFEGKTKCDPGDFCNKWTIESRSAQKADGTYTSEGKLYKNQKLLLALYNDVSDTKATDVDINEIYNYSFAPADITAFNVSDFEITFTIPDADSIISGTNLTIDNDEDSETNLVNYGLNEDPVGINSPPGTCPKNPEDDDCDGEVDEDNDEDAVILWKLTDGGSLSLVPIKGCLEETDPAKKGSDPCESDFDSGATPEPFSVTLGYNHMGENEQGQQETIQTFLARATGNPLNPNPKIQFEFLIIAPMEHMDISTQKKYEIPYIEYKVETGNPTYGPDLADPQFTIKSDGYYRGFKQSITSTITPKTTVPLFDFTIIQQE